ncbi:MAG: 50S ribosomal protein L15 [Planctomycetes bacterium]|nr:50S ribosomal protein L15 [Planctomycetota bacterium]
MNLQEILSAAGPHKRSKRIGRGRGSGKGKTSGRGHKGYGQRAGSKVRATFEGGQNPLVRRIPKRGFNNAQFAELVQIVNIQDLQRAFEDGGIVDVKALLEKGLIDHPNMAVKLLGEGELTRKLTVRVSRASLAAAEKVATAGGTLELSPRKKGN